jgi:hypothetical protein
MIHFLCVLIGFYLVFDAIYLAGKSDHENRHCLIAKYVGAGMSGGYLVWLSLKDLVLSLGILTSPGHLFISNEAMQILLLLGLTIAFFMWPDTFWRLVEYLQKKKPDWHVWLMSHIKIKSRRLRDAG